MLDISPPPGSSVTTFEGGGAGPSGSGGQGGSGPGGKWHEGSNTPGPSRRGTGASMDNSGASPVAGPSAGSSQMTRQANAFTNAEAGPSNSNSPQPALVGSHRVASDPSGPLPSITPVSPLATPWIGNMVKLPPNQLNQRQRQRSLSHSPPSPISNENVNPNWGLRPPMQQHSQSQPASQKNNAKGYLTENMSSQPSTPYYSQPSSPSSPVSPSTTHHRQPPHTRSASADQTPTKHSSSHPRSSSTIPNTSSPLTFNAANHASSNAPIHARFSHTQTHHHNPLISGTLPPTPSSPLGSGSSDVDEFMVIPSSGEEVSGVGGGWKLVSKGYAAAPINGRSQGPTGGTGFMVLGKKDKGETLKMIRRRTAIDPSGAYYLSSFSFVTCL